MQILVLRILLIQKDFPKYVLSTVIGDQMVGFNFPFFLLISFEILQMSSTTIANFNRKLDLIHVSHSEHSNEA